MGSILKASCLRCRYGTELFIGGGLADCELDTAVSAVHQDEAAAAALKECESFQIKRSAAVCKKCKKLEVSTDITYWQKGNEQEMHIWGVCSDCGGHLLPISPDAVDMPCPKCGGDMSLTLIGRWD